VARQARQGVTWFDVAVMDWQGRQGEARRGPASQDKAGKQGANKTMSRETDNALLLHGGDDDISIPGAALRQIIGDALTPDCGDLISQMRLQNDALEEANQALARRVVSLSNEVRDLKNRLDGREFD